MKKILLVAVIGGLFSSSAAVAEKPEWAGQKPSKEQLEAHKDSMKSKGYEKRLEVSEKVEELKQEGNQKSAELKQKGEATLASTEEKVEKVEKKAKKEADKARYQMDKVKSEQQGKLDEANEDEVEDEPKKEKKWWRLGY